MTALPLQDYGRCPTTAIANSGSQSQLSLKIAFQQCLEAFQQSLNAFQQCLMAFQQSPSAFQQCLKAFQQCLKAFQPCQLEAEGKVAALPLQDYGRCSTTTIANGGHP